MRSVASLARAQARGAYAACRPINTNGSYMSVARAGSSASSRGIDRWTGCAPTTARLFHSPAAALGPVAVCRHSTSVACAVNMSSTRSHAHHDVPRTTGRANHSLSTFAPRPNTPVLMASSSILSLPGSSSQSDEGDHHSTADAEEDDGQEQAEEEAIPPQAIMIKVVVYGVTTYCLLKYTDIPAMFHGLPPSVLGILGLQLLVFGLHRRLPSLMSFRHLYTSWEHVFVQHHYHTLLTSVFSHRAMAHLAINSFVLASFGPLVVNAIGEKDFVLFYVVAGIVSSLCGVLGGGLLARAGLREIMRLQPALGASGSTMALIGMSAVLYPDAQLSLFGILPWLPASTIVPGIAAMDFLGLTYHTLASTMPRLGHAAHMSGIAMGYIWTHTYLNWRHPHINRFLTKRANMSAEEKDEINRKANEEARLGL